MRRLAHILLLVGVVVALAGCGYIVTPADENTSTPVTAGVWAAIATAVAPTSGGDLHVELAIRNDTGDWSAMQVAPSGAVSLTTSDGHSSTCGKVFIGTGGTSLAPGFQMRGYTAGTKTKPETQLLSVDCQDAKPAAGSKLVIDYSYVVGPFNYYSPSSRLKATLDVDLDKVSSDLVYPVAKAVDGLVQNETDPIEAINKCALTLKSVARKSGKLEFAWHTENPTAYPTYVHIGTPPVIGSDGIIYGIYESPHLADTPITPANQSANWTTDVAVPKDLTGLHILVSVESQQQKFFVSHAIGIAEN